MKPTERTEEEIQTAVGEIVKALQGRRAKLIPFQIWEIPVIIAHLQLALRHPKVKGDASVIAETVCRRLIDALPESVRPHMLAGFDPANDIGEDELREAIDHATSEAE